MVSLQPFQSDIVDAGIVGEAVRFYVMDDAVGLDVESANISLERSGRAQAIRIGGTNSAASHWRAIRMRDEDGHPSVRQVVEDAVRCHAERLESVTRSPVRISALASIQLPISFLRVSMFLFPIFLRNFRKCQRVMSEIARVRTPVLL